MAVYRPPKASKTYQANPFPTTANSGAQGQYGAMYPTVNLGWNGNNPYGGTGANLTETPWGQKSPWSNNGKTFNLATWAGNAIVNAFNAPPQTIAGVTSPYQPLLVKTGTYTNNTPSRSNPTGQTVTGNTYSLNPVFQTEPKPTNVFTAPKPSNFDYVGNVRSRNEQALSIMANGGIPATISAEDARTLGIGQGLIDAGYQMYGGQLVAPSQQTGTTTQQNGATPAFTDPTAIWGRYAEGNKAYSGQAKTAQEAFQQGQYKPKKRWWIGRNRKSAPAEPQPTNATSSGQWTGQIGLVDFNTGP